MVKCGGPWPDWPSRGTGAGGARAVIRTQTRLRGRGLHPRHAGAWPHGPSRPLAFGKGGELRSRHAAFLRSAKAERTQQSPRRGRELSSRSSAAFSRRSEVRIVQSGHGPRNDSPGTGQLSQGLRWESGQVREKPRKHAVSRICPHGQEPKLFQVAFDHRGKCRNPHKT